MTMMMKDRAIQVAAAKTLGFMVGYIGVMIALLYPVAEAAGYLA